MTYFVSRQSYYYSGERVVEIAEGGLGSAGCDMYVNAYPGEGEEYHDPREAVEAAILIWKQWVDDSNVPLPSGIAIGFGCIAELEPSLDLIELREYAEAEYDELEKCARCNGLIMDEPYIIHEFGDDDKYCTEYCAEEAYNDIMSYNYEEAEC